jgi:hypothetical protein
MFEAQVKAQDEADEIQRQQEEYMQQQIQQMMEQGLFSYDPNTGQFIPGPGLAGQYSRLAPGIDHGSPVP